MRQKIWILFVIFPLMMFSQEDNAEYKKAKSYLYENPDLTISISKKLLKTEIQPDEKTHLNLLISNAYIVKRNTDSSLYYILKTKELVNTNIKLQTKVKILNSIAIQYQQMEMYDKALETLDQSTEYSNQLPNTDNRKNYFQAINNSVRGMIYKSLSNTELAIEKLKLAESQFKSEKRDKMNAANISIVLYNIGYCYLDIDKPAESKVFFTEAIQYGEESGQDILKAFAYKGYADYLNFIKQYKQSNDFLLKAEKLANETKDLTLKTGIYNIFSQNELALNNWEQFLFYKNKYDEIQKEKQTIEDKSLLRLTESQDTDYQKQIKENKRRFLIYRGLILLITLLILGVLFRYFRKTKANNLIKSTQFREIFK